jgi:hypothetical protein
MLPLERDEELTVKAPTQLLRGCIHDWLPEGARGVGYLGAKKENPAAAVLQTT